MNLEDVSIKELREKALEIRKELIDLSVIQNIHIGGDLSITDIMTVLWQYQLKFNPKEPNWEGRDRFVLSKGHSSAAMALNQAKRGCFKKEEVMNEYAMDEGRFSMHPCKLINPYVEISTGSLGHGMPIACGIAAALRLKSNMTSRVYTIMGDGEQSEGSVWEAALSAVKYRLGNLISIIDNNQIEGDGFINDITGLGDIACKYRSFGWNVIELNGNDMAEIILFVDGVMRHVDQLVDDVLVILRQRFSHFASREFCRDEFRDLDQADQHSGISLVFFVGGFVFFQYALGIINQRGEIVFLPFGKVVSEG